jgi:hypothetical protein
MEILDLVEGAFVGPSVTKTEVLEFARDLGARPEVLHTLTRLDADRRFGTPRDLWADLPDVPVEL